LSLRLRRLDNKLVHRSGLGCDNKRDDDAADSEIHELETLPLGNHIRHLLLVLRDTDHKDPQLTSDVAQYYSSQAAFILDRTPCLQSLEIVARFGNWGDEVNLSLDFCQALSRLIDLRTLQLRGFSIPAGCPTLGNVEHIQTNAKVHSFECLPRLKDLRQDPDYFSPDYHIPSDVLARLEVLHFCPSEESEDLALLVRGFKEIKNLASKQPLALRELVITGYPLSDGLLEILDVIASPHLHTFVCFGTFFRINGANYDELVWAVRRAFPNLTNLVFECLKTEKEDD